MANSASENSHSGKAIPSPSSSESPTQTESGERQVLLDRKSGISVTLIPDSNDCEVRPVLNGSYHREGKLLRFRPFMNVNRLPGEPREERELYFEITDAGLVDLQYAAKELKLDLQFIDSAAEIFAKEAPSRTPPTAWQLAQYFKEGSRLHKAAIAGRFLDSFGNEIYIPLPGETPSLSRATYKRLARVAPIQFWSPYGVK
jgi:hypothetical protein